MAANSPKHAGLEARQKLGFWHANRFLILRRLSQLSIILMFLSGPIWNVWILKGNYSGSLLLDTVPMTDPLMTAQVLATGYQPEWTVLIGALIIVAFYAIVGSKLFCSWVCPMNIVTDSAAWLRRKLGIRQSAKLPRGLRYIILAVILIGSAISGTLLWEWINPVAALGRVFVFGLGATLWLVLVVFLFDLLVVEHGWCGHLCPIGATYALIGAKSLIKVKVVDRNRCDNCMDCYNVCPEPQVLRVPLHGKPEDSTVILSKDCITCGRCIDVCAEKVFAFGTRFQGSIDVKNI
ncbi:quinol dehydrogenase ferredoxin subunit NapH [Mannheimia varigena]|uniref:Ferredoxin-type protein, NapH/MauN n=1 Tax=Mannheimia varigena USDA-ARS-USMARC-1296 TaxID=1433287 RepID=W0QC09_9PAST|nr:quinol dehydrogenase ferredoxin subunit NapH [Mannheimia varigena]AHG74753.1 Ferredoxin-type protein, NapH/MauN [Mannheimia varigena USDA-ARS-USMARC-1296]AHG76874.1 Ferredoxin-type protein, NapH/MauN [Mannheimia varigena USDA-ARS-USMARC-1312]AHG80471.1 Ferredoxin-type protein, NapH/MauN [Mannheimia varigena USDA-ARS-USMARC-1388]AWW33956.1 quinol dehydrogenase ferredoxin subunit NapH [Mannheimia varigena]MDY2948235.1 quinol dehydrogenase ferredoxin subunit NapH [Mannheimia varigena]